MASTWLSAGAQTNPAANAILADTGPIARDPNSGAANGFYKFLISSTVAAVVVIEHRDAANASNVPNADAVPTSHIIPVNGYLEVQGLPFFIQDQERVRVRLNAAITGSIEVTIVPLGT